MSDDQPFLPMDLPAPTGPAGAKPGEASGVENLDWRKISQSAVRYFRPTAPVNVLDVFSGRDRQITRVCDVVMQEGQHAILYGERGVGKTSLANVLSAYLVTTGDDEHTAIVSPRVNCDVDDTFDNVWRKILSDIRLEQQTRAAGFTAHDGADGGQRSPSPAFRIQRGAQPEADRS